MDSTHISTWLHGLCSSSSLDHAFGPDEKDMLSVWLDLPCSYEGADVKSLSLSADEELLGSFAAIASSLVTFCMKTKLPIYMCIAEAMEALADATDPSEGEALSNLAPTLTSIRDAAERAETALCPYPLSLVTNLH